MIESDYYWKSMENLINQLKIKLRRVAKASVAYTAYSSGLVDPLAARRTGINGQPRIIILGYHRVVKDFKKSSETAIPSLLISAETFRRQLELVRRKFDCITLDEVYAVLRGERTLKRDSVVLTFDDGYRDFYDVAFPILKNYGLPGTIFVPSTLLGMGMTLVHDQLYYLVKEMVRQNYSLPSLLESLNLTDQIPSVRISLHRNNPDYFGAMRALFEIPYEAVNVLINELKTVLGVDNENYPDEYELLSWPMLSEMAASGITIGAHTCNHVLLTREALDRADMEISNSKKEIEQKLGIECNHFAYPDGRYNEEIASLVRKAGYKTACTIEDRPNTFQENLFKLKRKLLWEKACLGIFSDYSEIVAECQFRGLFANPAYKWQPTSIQQ